MKKDLIVGISDYKISRSPNTITTYALGSCVGVAIYDTENYIGGLCHIQLADSKLFTENGDIKKYADTAIPHMVNEMLAYGAEQDKLVAKVAGGANMLTLDSNISLYQIGELNVKAVIKILEELNIPVLAKDVGGRVGRTMVLNLENLAVHIKYVDRTTDKIRIL